MLGDLVDLAAIARREALLALINRSPAVRSRVVAMAMRGETPASRLRERLGGRGKS